MYSFIFYFCIFFSDTLFQLRVSNRFEVSPIDCKGCDSRKPVLRRGVANNEGADQPVHPHSLISPFFY